MCQGLDGAGSSGMNKEQLGSIEQELREKEMENQVGLGLTHGLIEAKSTL